MLGDLGKLIVAKGFKSCPNSKKSPDLVTLFASLIYFNFFNFQTQIRRHEPEQLVHVVDREVAAARGDVDGADVQRPLRDPDRKRLAARRA